MSADFDFLRRARSLEQQLGGGDPSGLDVARVQIVSDRRHSDSFERAPQAIHWQSLAAPAAGSHNGLVFSAVDTGSPICGLAMRTFLFSAATATIGVGLIDSSTLANLANLAGVTPLEVDPDPELSTRLTRFTIPTADIPAATTAGWCAVFPGAGISPSLDRGWPMLKVNNNRQLVIIQGGAAEAMHFRACWQAVRL